MKIHNLTLSILAALLLTACGSSRKISDNGQTPSANVPSSKPATTQPVTTQPVTQQQQPAVKQFMSDIDLTVGMGKDRYNLGGKVAMKRGQVVRLNLTFMGFIEVGVIEFTPEYILVVNRMGKEYTKATYDSIEELRKNNVTFSRIEETAWQNLYAENGKAAAEDMDTMLEQLINSNMKDGKKVSIDIAVGMPDTQRQFETYTTVKSSYTEVPVQVLMARLMSFAK